MSNEKALLKLVQIGNTLDKLNTRLKLLLADLTKCPSCEKSVKDGENHVKSDDGRRWHSSCLTRSEEYYEEFGR